MSNFNDLQNWGELAARLHQYAVAASSLGGMNDLDKALFAAEEGLRMLDALQKAPLERHR